VALFHHIDVVRSLEVNAKLNKKIYNKSKVVGSWKLYRDYIVKQLKKKNFSPMVAYLASAYNGGLSKPARYIRDYGYEWHKTVGGSRYKYLMKITKLGIRENISYVKKVISLLSIMKLIRKIKPIPLNKVDTSFKDIAKHNLDSIKTANKKLYAKDKEQGKKRGKKRGEKQVKNKSAIEIKLLGKSRFDNSNIYLLGADKRVTYFSLYRAISNRFKKAYAVVLTNKYAFPYFKKFVNKGDKVYIKVFNNKSDYMKWLGRVKFMVKPIRTSKDGAFVFRLMSISGAIDVKQIKEKLRRMGFRNVKITNRFGKELLSGAYKIFYLKAYD